MTNTNPMEEVASHLVSDLGKEGTICTYTSYEKSQIETLAGNVPNYFSDLESIHARLWDLAEVIKNHYYHPDFCGSFSIKTILPVLIPGMTYKDLDVSGGGEAMVEYLKLIDPLVPLAEREKATRALLEYCRQDTFAMVQLYRTLLRKAEEKISGPG